MLASARRGRALQVGEQQLLEADRLGVPARPLRLCQLPEVGGDQHGRVPVAVGAADDRPWQVAVRGLPRHRQHLVRGEQAVDRAGQLQPPAGEHEQPVAEPLQLGDHVRGDDHGEAGAGGRRPSRPA